MKTLRAALLLLLLPGAMAADLRATDTVAVSMRFLGNPPVVQEASAAPPMHVFGGKPLAFAVTLDAQPGTRLRLRADLVQTAAGNIALPLQRDVPVSGELAFEALTHLTASCTLPDLPATSRVTRMLLTLRAVEATGDRPPLVQATTEIFVYPPEAPGQWQKMLASRLAQNGLTRLEVFGRGPRLRRFFKDRHVNFEDGGGEWPVQLEPGTLYAGDDAPPVPARLSSADGLRLVLFEPIESPVLLPGVYESVDAHRGAMVKVTLPDLLTRLADDPRCQQTVAEIFRLACDASPATPNLEPVWSP